MTNIIRLRPTKQTLEREIQHYVQDRINDFITNAGLYPQDIVIGLVTFSKNDGQIEVVVDGVEIKVASVLTYEWEDLGEYEY